MTQRLRNLVRRALGFDHNCAHDMKGKSQFCIICGSPCHCGQ